MEVNDTIDPHAADDVVPTTAVAGAPVAAAPDADDKGYKVTDDGNIVEVGGKKYFREEALHAERTRAQGYANTIKQLEPLMPEFEQFLRQKQGGERATVGRATRSAAPADNDYTDDELTGFAITRGYYDKDNQPDLKRAQDELDIMAAIADRRAQKAVGPVAAGSARDRARLNAERAVQHKFADGEPIADEKYINAAFEALPDELKADPNVSNMLLVLAAGLETLDARREGRGGRRREPVFREGGRGRVETDNEGSLDALDRAAARARGKSPDAWAKLQKQVGGGANVGGTVLDEV